MEEECLSECDRRVYGGVDRISQLPDEIIVVILSFLRFKEAAATTVLSSRWLDLWKHIPHIKFNRISQLPNQIIAVILSFLSLKEAATTSVLSSRWSDLWKHTPNLEFDMHNLRDYNSDDDDDDDDDYDDDDDDDDPWDAQRNKCIEIVNSVIQSHKALSLKKFRLALPLNYVAKCDVTKWLEFVFSRPIESLELIFDKRDDLVHEELLRESRICLQPQTDLIFFQSLKRLWLRCLKVSGEDIELFLRNCPLLEQLMIHEGTLTSDVQLCGANLVHLDIFYIRCNGQKSVKVSAPNLTYMRFALSNEREVKLLVENVPKLVEAEFHMYTPDMVVQRFSSSASCHFSQLQILKLILFESKMFYQLRVILANGFQIPNLKKLVITCLEMCNHSFLPLTALIWAFPRLEEFKSTYSGLYKEQTAFTQVIMNGGRSPHQHLKVFELRMTLRQRVSNHIAELVMYISNNCVALRKISIDCRPYLVDPATRHFITQRLQENVPNHIQLELFNHRF